MVEWFMIALLANVWRQQSLQLRSPCMSWPSYRAWWSRRPAAPFLFLSTRAACIKERDMDVGRLYNQRKDMHKDSVELDLPLATVLIHRCRCGPKVAGGRSRKTAVVPYQAGVCGGKSRSSNHPCSKNGMWVWFGHIQAAERT
jgi:hypothetical protein